MNHHQRHTPPGAIRALRCCALLVAVLSTREALATLCLPKFRATPGKVMAREYLLAVGAPELRFQKPIVPSVRPAARLAAASSQADETHPSPAAVVPGETRSAAPEHSVNVHVAPDETPPQKTRSGPSQRILPDNTRPNARPEDFLPFFRFPAPTGQSGKVDVIVPVPADAPSGAPLPPSSATYFQSPK